MEYYESATGLAMFPCGCPTANATVSHHLICPKQQAGMVTVTTAPSGYYADWAKNSHLRHASVPAYALPYADWPGDKTTSVAVVARPTGPDYGTMSLAAPPATAPALPSDLATKKDVQALAAKVEALTEQLRPKAPKRQSVKRPRKKKTISVDEGELWLRNELVQENDALRAENAQLKAECQLLRLNAQLGWGTEPYPKLEADDFDPN